ncbi:MAG: DNA recombination/repair protein RecA, partial [Acidobacteria bacterium]|nr:DNA recombination/repair protein RecA [Acidobacteriota bacterium]NIQ86381.1 DNA recombination/repair protein RecA [Acidobacteriota bacterium]
MATDRTGKPETDRDKVVELAISQIERQFGKGAIMRLGERGARGIAGIPTSSLSV